MFESKKQNNKNKLQWRDLESTKREVVDIGKNKFNIFRQTDANQCGPCSILNMIHPDNIQSTYNSPHPLRQNIPYHERGHINKDNVDKFWFTDRNIVTSLQDIYGSKNVEAVFIHNNNINVELLDNCTGMIYLKNGNHWVLIKKIDEKWYEIDSLSKSNWILPISKVDIINNLNKITNRSAPPRIIIVKKPLLIWRDA